MRQTQNTHRGIQCYSVILIFSLIPQPGSSSEDQANSEDQSSESSPSVALGILGIGLQCHGTVCKGEEGRSLNLEQVQMVECAKNGDTQDWSVVVGDVNALDTRH